MSKSPQVTGKIIEILPEERGNGKKGEWVKQIFVVETQDQYPVKLAFQAWGDIVNQIPKKYSLVTVLYKPESREYNGKWYTDLKPWKIEVDGKVEKPKEVVKTGLGLDTQENDDDLPF